MMEHEAILWSAAGMDRAIPAETPEKRMTA